MASIFLVLAFMAGVALSVNVDDLLPHNYIFKSSHRNETAVWVLELQAEDPVTYGITRGDTFPGPRGVVNRWTAGGAGNWSQGGNWSLGHKPTTGESIVFDGTSTANCTIDENTAVLDSFFMDAGYTGTVALGSYALDVTFTPDGSDFIGVEGTFNAGSGTIRYSGSWNTNSATFVYTQGTATIEATGTGDFAFRSGVYLYRLICAASGKTTTLTTSVRVSDSVVMNGGTLTSLALKYLLIYASTNPDSFVLNGTLTVYHLAIEPIGTTTNIMGGTYDVTYLELQGKGPASKTVLTGNLSVSGTLWVNHYVAGQSMTLTTQGYSIDASVIDVGESRAGFGALIASSSTITTTGDFRISTAQSYVTSTTGIFNIGGNWSNSSTSAPMDLGTSTVKLTGTSTQAVSGTGSNNTFHDIVFSGSSLKNFTSNFTTNNVTATTNATMQVYSAVTWTTKDVSTISATAGNILALQSDSAGMQFQMIAGSGVIASRVNVRDSNNTGTEIDASDGTCINGGNNRGWLFVMPLPPIDGEGTLAALKICMHNPSALATKCMNTKIITI